METTVTAGAAAADSAAVAALCRGLSARLSPVPQTRAVRRAVGAEAAAEIRAADSAALAAAAISAAAAQAAIGNFRINIVLSEAKL